MLGAFLKRALPGLASERRELGHDGYLHLLEARRGRGKSYNMTHIARRAVLDRTPVIANFGLNRYRLAVQAYQAGTFPDLDTAFDWVEHNVRLAEHWDDLLTAHNAIVLLDEASRIFDSRNRTAPPIALEFFQQSRKLQLTLILASQSFEWLDVRVRQLADVLWMVRKEEFKRGARAGTPKTFYLYGLDPFAKGLTDSVVRDRADFRWSVDFELSVATLYDSWELIRIIEGKPSWDSVGELTDWHVERGHIIERSDPLVALRARSARGREHPESDSAPAAT